MSNLFLQPDELVDLTGFKSARHQVRWLDQNRWRYALARNSNPKVTREYFSERVGARPSQFARQDNAAAIHEQPNFAAMDRR